MNKNLLIKQNNELFDKIRILKSKNASLFSQIANLEQEISNYKSKISALEIENSELKNRKEVVISQEAIEHTQEETIEVIEPNETVELPDEFNYASDIIGDIVIKAAGYINKLTESTNDNKKELINLILGRTEIAKAEILNAVSSEVTFSAKQDLINTQYSEAIEYFKSIIEQ